MATSSDIKIHRDHCRWSDERTLWHDDVRMWEQEIEELRGKLQRIEIALGRQKHELQVHAAAVRLYGERDARREHELACCEREGNEEKEMMLAQVHDTEISQQNRQRERHNELKASQRRLMSELRSLVQIADRLPPAADV
ncbi:MAG TPA: hypothetical protein VG826_05215 [Pirellulales bacterium]|nr:hypothetical protein [Pirellulales bacterium]